MCFWMLELGWKKQKVNSSLKNRQLLLRPRTTLTLVLTLVDAIEKRVFCEGGWGGIVVNLSKHNYSTGYDSAESSQQSALPTALVSSPGCLRLGKIENAQFQSCSLKEMPAETSQPLALWAQTEQLPSGEQKLWLTKLQMGRQSKICTEAQEERWDFQLLGPAVNQSEMCSGLADGFGNAEKIW